MNKILELYISIITNYGKHSKHYETIKEIVDIFAEYNITDVEDLRELCEDFVKSGEILYECPNCKCRTVREEDRYCPECGGRVDD